MRIKQMISQYRRDFTALMQCEFCEHTETLTSGYDDSYYHREVIPNQKCKKCGESTISGGGTINPQATKYSDDVQI